MILLLCILLLAIAASLVFSTLTYSLRELPRMRLAELLDRRGLGRYVDLTFDNLQDLIFLTAILRLIANVAILLCLLRLLQDTREQVRMQFMLATFITLVITLLLSVAIPNALARYGGAAIVAVCVRPLNWMRIALLPITKIMHAVDGIARRAAGTSPEAEAEQIEQEILSVVEEGEKEGVVDEQEREMIESVIDFRNTQVGQIMTPRPAIVALEITVTLPEVKRAIEESAHSRLPVYEATVDQIAGILYARDLLKMLGAAPQELTSFNLRGVLRPAVYVPETKLLRDLLRDFRLQKVHIAIVLDEYGGTAGLVTIEDILEEIVGDISDEHEPAEPAMLKRAAENVFEVEARMYIDELNSALDIQLPEDAGYDTLGGFISTTLGRIPPAGTVLERQGPKFRVKFTVLDAEPAKINRVRIELTLLGGPEASVATPPSEERNQQFPSL